jgi:hypothetical protein
MLHLCDESSCSIIQICLESEKVKRGNLTRGGGKGKGNERDRTMISSLL